MNAIWLLSLRYFLYCALAGPIIYHLIWIPIWATFVCLGRSGCLLFSSMFFSKYLPVSSIRSFGGYMELSHLILTVLIAVLAAGILAISFKNSGLRTLHIALIAITILTMWIALQIDAKSGWNIDVFADWTKSGDLTGHYAPNIAASGASMTITVLMLWWGRGMIGLKRLLPDRTAGKSLHA